MSAPRWLLILALALVPACTCGGRPQVPPRLEAIVPAFGFDADETAVEVKGEAFTPRASLRWGGAEGDTAANAGFELFLGEQQLTGVSWNDARQLSARIPAGLSPGRYSLRLVDPYGAEAQLEDAFEVRRRQGARLAAEISTDTSSVRLGAAVLVRLDVTNVGDTSAETVLAVPRLPTGTARALLTAVMPGSARLAPGETRRFQLTYVTNRVGEVVFTAEASGVDTVSGAALATGTLLANPVSVISPPLITSLTRSARQVVSVGQTIELELEATNLGQVSVRQLAAVATFSPLGLVDPRTLPLNRDLVPGGTQFFAFTFDSLARGDVTFQLEGLGTDSQTNAPVAMLPSTAMVTIENPAALVSSISAPARVSVGQRFTVTATVTNTGEARALTVSPTLSLSGSGSVVQVSAPAPVAAIGAPAIFQWVFDATGAGPVQMTVGAGGFDENSMNRVSTAPSSFTVNVATSATLTASLAATPAVVNVGQAFTVSLTVGNAGQSTALAVTPSTPTVTGTGSATLISGPMPASVNVVPSSSQVFTWQFSATAAGPLSIAASASGTDAQSMAAISSPPALVTLTSQRPAALSSAFAAPARVNVGQQFGWSLSVANSGDSAANAVTPGAITLLGASPGTPDGGPTPALQTVPGGSSRTFAFAHVAGDAGTLRFQATPSGIDAIDGNPVTAPSATSSIIQIERPAGLVGTLTIPSVLPPATPFSATMRVTNIGEANANVVAPSTLTATNAVFVSGPSPASATLAADAGVTFTWTFSAAATGAAQLQGSAAGIDANDGRPVSTGPLSSNTSPIGEAFSLAVDPFGDATAFSYLFAHGGRIFLGPRKTGFGAVSMNPDGSAPATHSFAFARDPGVGAAHANGSAAPYPSIGAPGCAANTPACGPDNENGRGLFFSGLINGVEWMGVAGASTGKIDYVYLSTDTDPTLDFRFVDLSNGLGGATRGLSAAHVFRNRLYLGFPDTGGSRPYLQALLVTPPAPGLNTVASPQIAAGANVLDLQGGVMAGIGGNYIIDAINDFNDRLYVANTGGIIRSTTNLPQGAGFAPADWVPTTPSAAAYLPKGSVVTPKTSGILPSDRAFPALVAFQGRFYAARNTTVGPQLWGCTPGADFQCQPAEWSLVAANSAGDGQLSQFNDAANTSIGLLAATATALFIGFNNNTGVQIFKTTALTPTAADFTGRAGCVASTTGCQGLNGDGLGAPLINRQIFDARALTFGANDWLYLVTGDGTAGVQIWRIPG